MSTLWTGRGGLGHHELLPFAGEAPASKHGVLEKYMWSATSRVFGGAWKPRKFLLHEGVLSYSSYDGHDTPNVKADFSTHVLEIERRSFWPSTDPRLHRADLLHARPESSTPRGVTPRRTTWTFTPPRKRSESEALQTALERPRCRIVMWHSVF